MSALTNPAFGGILRLFACCAVFALLAACGVPAANDVTDNSVPADAAVQDHTPTEIADDALVDAGSPAPDAGDAGDLPGIVARVDDDAITRDEYLKEEHKLRERLFVQRTGRAPLPNVSTLPELTEEQKATVLNAMIEARIFGQLAADSGITVSDDEVEAQLQTLKEQIALPGEYERLLGQSNQSEDEFRENIRLRLLMEKYGDSLVEHAEFTDAHFQQAYDRLSEAGSLRVPNTADLRHIFLPVTFDKDAPDEAAVKAEMDAIRDRIDKGEDFEAVAKEVSQDEASAERGGLYENVRRGQLGQGFDERLFTLPLNEVSEPFRSLRGWHIMTVIARHDPRELAFEEARPVIEKMLLAAQRTEAMSRRVADARNAKDIELFMDIDLTKRKQKPVIAIPPDADFDSPSFPLSAPPAPVMEPE